jgi:hypothetical protein
VGGLERLFEGVDFVAVTASYLGELGGECADHAAWVFDVFRWRGWSCSLLLGAELFHACADLRVAVEEVE